MARFLYEGFTKLAQIKRGFVDAKDLGDAAEILRGHGLNAQNIQPEDKGIRSVLEGGEVLNFPETPTQAPAPADFRPWDYAKEKDRPAAESPAPSIAVETKPDRDWKWKRNLKKEVEAGLAKRDAALEALKYVREVGVPYYANTDKLLDMIEEEIRKDLVAAINRAIKERAKLG